jgi:hypothetical protein
MDNQFKFAVVKSKKGDLPKILFNYLNRKESYQIILNIINEIFKKSLPFIEVFDDPLVVNLPVENIYTRSHGYSKSPLGYIIFYIWYDPNYFIEIHCMLREIKFCQSYKLQGEAHKLLRRRMRHLYHRFENEDEIAPTIQKFIRHMLSEQLN